MTSTELKAKFYDKMALMEICQAEMKKLNVQIVEAMNIEAAKVETPPVNED